MGGGWRLAALKKFLLFQVKLASSVYLDLDACKIENLIGFFI